MVFYCKSQDRRRAEPASLLPDKAQGVGWLLHPPERERGGRRAACWFDPGGRLGAAVGDAALAGGPPSCRPRSAGGWSVWLCPQAQAEVP